MSYKPRKLIFKSDKYKDGEWLENEYYINKRSSTDIANECGVWPSVIIKYLHLYKIPIRSKKENRLLFPGSGFAGHKHTEESKKKTSDKLRGREVSEETKLKLSKSLMNRTFSEETLLKMKQSSIGIRCDDKNGNWKGGTSRKPYSITWSPRAIEEVRKRFNSICIICGKTEEENGAKMSVHHINYNKLSEYDDNWITVPLCYSCHMKSSIYRHYFFNLLINYWIANKEYTFNDIEIFLPINMRDGKHILKKVVYEQ